MRLLLAVIIVLPSCDVGPSTSPSDDSPRSMDEWLGDSASRDFVQPGNGLLFGPIDTAFTAMMVVDPGYGTDRARRIKLTRNGPWAREARLGSDEVVVSRLDRGTSAQFRLKDGRNYHLTLWGAGSSTSKRWTKTPKVDHLLGEQCAVWEAIRDPLIYRNCLTNDGILLWQEVTGRSGNLLSSARAESIRRTRPGSIDLALPASLFDIDAWLDPAEVKGSEPNDKVTLIGAANARVERPLLVVRRLAGSVSVDNREGKIRMYTFTGRGLRLHYTTNGDGQFDQMTLGRLSQSTKATGSPGVALKSSAVVMGRSCNWFDAMPGVADLSVHRCLTENGLTLAQTVTNRGNSITLTARRIEGGRLGLRDMVPPADLFATAADFTTVESSH